MCGDFREGLELAVGAPHPVSPSSSHGEHANVWAGFDIAEPTEQELREAQREEETRRPRIDDTPMMKMAHAIAVWCRIDCFASRAAAVRAVADDILRRRSTSPSGTAPLWVQNSRARFAAGTTTWTTIRCRMTGTARRRLR